MGLCPSLGKEAQCFAGIGAVLNAEDLNFQKLPLDRTIFRSASGTPWSLTEMSGWTSRSDPKAFGAALEEHLVSHSKPSSGAMHHVLPK